MSFQALVLDSRLAVMYLTDTHVPSIMRGNMRNYTEEGVSVSKKPRENHTSARVRCSCCSQMDIFVVCVTSSSTVTKTEIPTQIVTILSGVTQERRGDLQVEDYYQALTDPQALQLDTRLEDLDLLYFSDYGTGYIYSVRAKETCLVTPPPANPTPSATKTTM